LRDRARGERRGHKIHREDAKGAKGDEEGQTRVVIARAAPEGSRGSDLAPDRRGPGLRLLSVRAAWVSSRWLLRRAEERDLPRRAARKAASLRAASSALRVGFESQQSVRRKSVRGEATAPGGS